MPGEILIRQEQVEKNIGRPIDFLNTEHQSLLISYTYNDLLRYKDVTIRSALRLDKLIGDDESSDYLSLLTNGENENPLNKLLSENIGPIETINPLSLGYAWLNLLDKHHFNMKGVAKALKLSIGQSNKCFRQVIFLAKHQWDLPLNLSEQPGPWRRFHYYRIPEQLLFPFNDDLVLFSNQEA